MGNKPEHMSLAHAGNQDVFPENLDAETSRQETCNSQSSEEVPSLQNPYLTHLYVTLPALLAAQSHDPRTGPVHHTRASSRRAAQALIDLCDTGGPSGQ